MGCAGRVANGINTVHAAWIREGTGQGLAGFRRWIPEEQVKDPVTSLVTGLPLDLRFRTKGELAAEIFDEAVADGMLPDFVCGDESTGTARNCAGTLSRRTGLRAARGEDLPHHPV